MIGVYTYLLATFGGMQAATYLRVEVDGDELGVLAAVDERLAEVERAGLVDARQPLVVHLLLEPARHRESEHDTLVTSARHRA